MSDMKELLEDIKSDIKINNSDMAMIMSIIKDIHQRDAKIDKKMEKCIEIITGVKSVPVEVPEIPTTSDKTDSIAPVKKIPIVIEALDERPHGSIVDYIRMEGGKLIQSIENSEFIEFDDVIQIKVLTSTIKKTKAELNEIYHDLPIKSTKNDYPNKKLSTVYMKYFAFSGDYNCKLFEMKGGQFVLAKLE